LALAFSGSSSRRLQKAERRAVVAAGLAAGIEGEMQDAARRLDGRERAGMDLAQHGRAQGVRRKPRAIAAADGDFRAHGR
jgi:hypothetical protein